MYRITCASRAGAAGSGFLVTRYPTAHSSQGRGTSYGFAELVDDIIYLHECGLSKPDPGDLYTLACERLQVEPAQLVFVEHYPPCVAGARQAGIHAVLFQDNAQTIGEIERLLAR